MSYRLHVRRIVLSLAVASAGCHASDLLTTARWQSLPSRVGTQLLEVRYAEGNSARIMAMRGGGFELSSGAPVNFDSFYRTQFQDLRIAWMTPISENWGLIWGLGTGEKGLKYSIEPSVKLGMVFDLPLSPLSRISFRYSAVLGGYLKEKPCVGNYGEIGGIQTVNCRLAATELPPAETLRYLLREKPMDAHSLMIRFVRSF